MDKRIDLNSDVGEGFGNYRLGNDEEIMKYITSANVACGFHAGDPLVMRSTVNSAKQHKVAVGAHPGLPDLLGFGRRNMDITAEEAKCYTIYQVGALKAFAQAAKMKLNHVKPHGALYPMTAKNEALAKAIVEGIIEVDPELIVYGPTPVSGSKATALSRIARDLGIKVIGEIYPDLEYDPDGTVIVERVKRMVDPLGAARKVIRFIEEGKIKAVDGTTVEIEANSVCVHGDTPNAPEILRTLRIELKKANIDVVPIKEIMNIW